MLRVGQTHRVNLMTDDRMFDPRLVVDANRSFSWIFRAFEAFKRDPNQRIGDLLAPHIHVDHCDLINPGLVLAACYVYFVYPRETALNALPLDGMDVAPFHLSREVEPHELLRRLRNALSHGRFSIDDEGVFSFQDHRQDGTDALSLRIHFADLGMFVDAFAKRAVHQFLR